jgi:hypothetical protein
VRRALRAAACVPLLLGASCRTPDPAKELQVTELEAYWTVDSAVGERQYIAPALRFHLKNVSSEPARTVQATATFRRKGEEETDWGTAWEDLTPKGKTLAPGQSQLVVLRSDGRYYSSGEPAAFFEHPQFKDAVIKLYVRSGSSPWVLLATAEVERRIGTKTLPGPTP